MSKKLTRKEREYLENKQNIMKAAEQLFADVGYHVTTMEQIAEESEYSKGTLYNYFDNKEHLFFCLLDKKLELFLNTFKNKIRNTDNAESKLSIFIVFYIDFFSQNLGFFKIAQTEKYRLNTHLRENLISNLKERYILHISMISEIVQEFGYEVEKSILLASSINGILNSLMTRKLLIKESLKPERLRAFAIETVFKLLK